VTWDLPVGGAAVTLVMARALGLCATAPLLGEAWIGSVRARLAFVLAVALALAPLRAASLAAAPLLPQVLALVPWELGLGLVVGATARAALIAAELAGAWIGGSLGLGFAAQYDARVDDSGEAMRALARAFAALAFLGAGGLEALVYACAAPLRPAAVTAALGDVAPMIAHAAESAIGLMGPVVLAALVGNLGLALLQRAAPSINVFSFGLATSALIGGAALLVNSAAMIGHLQQLADRAVRVLSAAP
jgi:flagellar biosynthesis protein FliR